MLAPAHTKFNIPSQARNSGHLFNDKTGVSSSLDIVLGVHLRLVTRPGLGHALVATASGSDRLHRVLLAQRLQYAGYSVLEDTLEPELVSTSLLGPALCTSSPDRCGSDVGEAPNSNSNIPPRCTRGLV